MSLLIQEPRIVSRSLSALIYGVIVTSILMTEAFAAGNKSRPFAAHNEAAIDASIRTGDLDTAEDLARRAVSHVSRIVAPDALALARAYGNLAAVLTMKGALAQAADAWSAAANVRHTDLVRRAFDLSNLAGVEVLQGKYPSAEKRLMTALDIQSGVLGRNHPLVAETLGRIATVYRRQKRYADAAQIMTRGLAILRASVGPQAPGVGIGLLQLSAIHIAQGDFGAGRAHLVEGIAILKRTLGPRHPSVVKATTSLAALDAKAPGLAAASAPDPTGQDNRL